MNTIGLAAEQDTQTLIKWLLNAAVTKKLCNGHYKANSNKMLTEIYEGELLARGLNVCVIQYPVTKVLIDKRDVTDQGMYNGEGAF